MYFPTAVKFELIYIPKLWRIPLPNKITHILVTKTGAGTHSNLKVSFSPVGPDKSAAIEGPRICMTFSFLTQNRSKTLCIHFSQMKRVYISLKRAQSFFSLFYSTTHKSEHTNMNMWTAFQNRTFYGVRRGSVACTLAV